MTSLPMVEYGFECADRSWRVRALVVSERVNQPFVAELELIHRDAVVTDELLGQVATLTMSRGDAVRTFVGEVVLVEGYAANSGETHARVQMVPKLARAAEVSRLRIFQDQAVADVVREVLGEYDEVQWELALQTPRQPRDYIVQYDETDLAFVQRLLEDEGICWVLDQGDGRDLVRLIEGSDAFQPIAGEPELQRLTRAPDLVDVETITHLSLPQRVNAAPVVMRSWHWLTDPVGVSETLHPEDADAAASAVQTTRRWASDEREQLARVHHEQRAAERTRAEGRSNVTALAAGRYFAVDTGAEALANLLVVSVTHRADCPDVEQGGGQAVGLQRDGAARGAHYANTFECADLRIPYRPRRVTPRPRVIGFDTAVVVGPHGEEIHTDVHGRIKVRMHWDRSGTPDGDASCWLRVSQPLAGDGWGHQAIPRVGMEVMVAYLGGDPDRPVCMGALYNGSHRTPYALPDEKTRSGFRSQSTPGGQGYNELTFEDAAGAEQVILRAQRDLATHVLRNESRVVGRNQSIRVGHDQRVAVGGDQQITVDGNQTIAIEGGGTEGLLGSAVTVKGELSVEVTEPGKIVISAAESIELVVGKTRLRLDEHSIQCLAGAGAIVNMSEAIIMLPKGGALARLASSVTLQSSRGAAVVLDAVSAGLRSPLGAQVFLDHTATLSSGTPDESLRLGDGAELRSATIGLEASGGAKVALGIDAVIEGGEVRSMSANGSLSLDSGGAKLDGTTVDVTAMTVATVLAAMVKIN